MADEPRRSAPPTKVLLVDDHQVLVDALSGLLERQPDIEVTGTAGSLAQLAERMSVATPDVVLLDYDLPDGTGLDALPSLVEAGSRILMLTSYAGDEVLAAAVQAGVSGFITKHAGAERVADAVRAVAAGEAVIGPELLARLLPRFAGRVEGPSVLTSRERELLGLLAEGRTNQEIAACVHLSVNTVRNHLANIYAKLGARSRLEAVAIGVRERVIRLDP